MRKDVDPSQGRELNYIDKVYEAQLQQMYADSQDEFAQMTPEDHQRKLKQIEQIRKDITDKLDDRVMTRYGQEFEDYEKQMSAFKRAYEMARGRAT